MITDSEETVTLQLVHYLSKSLQVIKQFYVVHLHWDLRAAENKLLTFLSLLLMMKLISVVKSW